MFAGAAEIPVGGGATAGVFDAVVGVGAPGRDPAEGVHAGAVAGADPAAQRRAGPARGGVAGGGAGPGQAGGHLGDHRRPPVGQVGSPGQGEQAGPVHEQLHHGARRAADAGGGAAAQRPDGYLNSYVQVVGGGTPHRDLAWGHEFYCVGHLIQAAVAWHRTVGDDRLLAVAVRAADRIDDEFGPTGRSGVDGHPGIEMALVELTRVTGDRRYLTLAARMLELRGHGLLGHGRFGAQYWQDHQPVRQAATVAGHAVRQLYLDCGAVDVAVELDDHDLLAAVQRRWHDLVRTRTYLTGGMGSRHRDEAFGDPYELPPDRAYAETCAAIASVMLA